MKRCKNMSGSLKTDPLSCWGTSCAEEQKSICWRHHQDMNRQLPRALLSKTAFITNTALRTRFISIQEKWQLLEEKWNPICFTSYGPSFMKRRMDPGGNKGLYTTSFSSLCVFSLLFSMNYEIKVCFLPLRYMKKEQPNKQKNRL